MENKFSQKIETQEISLRLDQYDDIFSDFDIRPYSKRALSVDFLDEIKRASQDKNDRGIELSLHIPESKRDQSDESVIKDRLLSHFKRHCGLLSKEKNKIVRLGMGMIIISVLSMILAAQIASMQEFSENIAFNLLLVFLEPTAVFFLWKGLDQIIFNSKNVNQDLNFYRKMSNLEGNIDFKSY